MLCKLSGYQVLLAVFCENKVQAEQMVLDTGLASFVNCKVSRIYDYTYIQGIFMNKQF